MKWKREYFIIFTIMITEVLGWSLILPFLPLFAQDFGASPLVIGLILMSFSLFQFLTSPILGRLSDHYGRKPLLIFSQISTTVSYIILGFANALWVVFLSRIVDGVLGSNMAISRAYLSDISSKKDRSKVLAISGIAFGFGFLIGPAIGGYLSNLTSLSYRLPSFAAAGVSFFSILTTLFFLKETIKKKTKIKFSSEIYPFSSIIKYFKNPKTYVKLVQLLVLLLAHAIFVSNFALYSEKQLNLNAQDIGFVLMYVGIVSILNRGILLSKFIDIFGEKKLEKAGFITFTFGLIIMAYAPITIIMLIGMTLFALGASFAGSVLNGEISRRVSKNEQGEIMGVAASLQSISQIFGPLIGGFMINYFFPGSMSLVAAFVVIAGLFLVINKDKNRNNS